MSAKKGRAKKDDVVELRYWTFKFVDKSFGVVVEGYRDNDATGSKMDNWGSSQIKSAAENGKLLTSLSGSKYRLVDNIARVEQKKYGIPDSMIDLFEKGFPRNWEQILRPFYQKWFETNPLNAAKWWDHQQTLEKKRASLGVSLKKRSQSTGAVPRTQQLEAEKENQTGLMTPTKTTDDSIIRRSPRIMPTVMATPNVMKSFSTTALNNDKNDNEPTPRFCPVTDGRHAISRQSTVKAPQSLLQPRSRELVIPDVPAEGQTPRRSRAAKTPTTKTPAAAEATPIRRSLRSQSVLPTPSATSTPKLPAKATPKGTPRANSRAPSASPARKPAAKTPASAQKKKSPASSPAPARPQSVAKTENNLEFKAPPPVVKVPAEENVFKAPPPKVIKGEVLDSRRAMSMSSIHSTVLFDWFIQFHPNQVKKTGALPPFYFTGTKRTNGAQPLGWNTSPIVRVDEGANQFDWTFYTSSGNQYKISGRVNVREMAEQQIFPMEVAKAFEFGFPSNWLELLWNVFNAYRDKGFKKPLLAPRHTESDGNESVRSGQVNVNQTVTHAKSQRGRSLYTPLEHSFKMPQLSAERGGGERIKQKKRSIKYASSDDDDDTDAFMKTLRMSRYNYDSDHGPAGKRARRSNTGDLTADMRIIKNIQKRKAKLTREIAELDEYMFQVANKIDRKRREEKRLEDLHRGWEQQQPPRQRSRAGSELSSRKRKFQPIYEESESSSESGDEDSEDELKALSDSTSTDCDDGGDWRQARLKKNKKKFVPPPTNNNRRSKEKANIFEEENKTSESEEEDEIEEIPKPKKEKKRKWTQEDLTRLKHVVSHVKVRKEEDWQKIANTMGQEFKAEDCKDMAVKRLNWKAPKEKTSKPEEEAMVITTRPGTLGHAIQAGEECRKYLLGAGSQELDGFRRQAMDGEDDEQDIVANIAELDPDDSILEALKTPKLATASFKKSKNRTDQPFLPTLFADEDTPKTNGRKSLALEEPTTAKREENLRYLHEINRTDRSRLNNTTRMNMSTTNYSMIDRSRAADQVARKMDKITKTVRDQIPKRKPTSDVDEEDEEEM